MKDQNVINKKKIQRKVNLIRFILKIFAKQMTDMEHTIGKRMFVETEKFKVDLLTYGFENDEIRPLLVNIHGSGFTLGSAGMDDPFMKQFVGRCNVKVININYTLAPDQMFPYALEECYETIKYFKDNASKYRIDPNRIMIMGHSAGGNFSAAIGIKENSFNRLGLKGIILDYPPLDIATSPYDKPRPKGALPIFLSKIFDPAYCKVEERTNPLVSPLHASLDQINNFPPTLIITASNDSLYLEGEKFKDKLIDAGVDVTYKMFEDVLHGFTIMTPKQGKRSPKRYQKSLQAWDMIIDFVNENI